MNGDVYLQAIATGNADSFAAWMAEAELPLRRSLMRFAGQVDVEAVLQETLLRVWQFAPRFEPDGKPDALLRFAHTIARNLALSEARKCGRELELGEQSAPRDQLPDPMLRELLLACRRRLPPKPRAALDGRMGAHGAEPDAETAERLGMKKNTFLQNLTRARRMLEKCLQRSGVNLAEMLS